ncbi:hypothetical protein [Streptomyces sp. NPDC003393]
MLEITQSEADRSKALELIYGAEISTTRTWVETDSLLVTEVLGGPFGKYYAVVITNHAGEGETEELTRLEGELGKPLGECIIEKEHHAKEHPWFPGSKSFDLLTLYAG